MGFLRFSVQAVQLVLLFLINLIKSAAIGKVKLVCVLPAAKRIVDLEQLDVGKLACIFRRNCGIGWTVEILRGNLLACVRIEILEIGFREGTRTLLVDDLVHHRD